MTFPDLSEPEQRLWQAARTGQWADFRPPGVPGAPGDSDSGWDQAQPIRADVIRALLAGAGQAEPGSIPAVRLRGARVTGRLDLMAGQVRWPLICEQCYFEREVRLVEATTRTIRIVACYLPALNAARLRLDGILNLSASIVPGLVRLDEASVAGSVSARDAVIGTAGSTGEALSADGLSIDGGLDLVRLTANGSVSLRVARIAGSVDLVRARIANPDGRALVTSQAQIGGEISAARLAATGETRMHNCRIAASLGLQGARLSNPGGVALSAGGLTIDGGVFCTDGFAAEGEVSFLGARLASNLSLTGARLRNPAGAALTLDEADIRSVNAGGLAAEGTVSMLKAAISGDLELADAHLTSSTGGAALAADRASVGGALVLSGVTAAGELSLRSVQVGQRAILTGARLDSPGSVACRMSRASIGADLFGIGMTVTGGLRLVGLTVGAELTFLRARISNPGAVAIDCAGLRAAELSLRTDGAVDGVVNLRHAQVAVIKDDPAAWPAALSLDGMTYQAIEPRLRARSRLAWLSRDPDGYQPQPYEQLAAYYTAIGQQGQAREVLYARERQRAGRSVLARLWSRTQDVTVGYGYKPWRALIWLALLLATGSITYAMSPPAPLQATGAPHFNPVAYSLDLLLPVVDLGQKHAFNPAGADQLLSYLLMAAGWILVTTVAAGAARVLSRS